MVSSKRLLSHPVMVAPLARTILNSLYHDLPWQPDWFEPVIKSMSLYHHKNKTRRKTLTS